MAFSDSDVAKWEGCQPSTTQAQGLIPTVHLKCDGAHTQDCDVVVLYPELEAGGSEPQDYLHPQPAQDTPELCEAHSRNSKRKFKSFLKWKPSFVSMVVTSLARFFCNYPLSVALGDHSAEGGKHKTEEQKYKTGHKRPQSSA